MIIISTANGNVELSGDDAADYLASIPGELPVSYRLYKTTIWSRLTDAELQSVVDAMAAQPLRLRMMWNDAITVESDSEFFGVLNQFVTAVLGASRAAEVLAPEA